MNASFRRNAAVGARRCLRESTLNRLIDVGPQALSEIELISIILRWNSAGSHERVANVLAGFGSLRGLLTAERSMVLAVGLSRTHYALLHAALELARRHYQELMRMGSALANPRATREYLRMRLRDLPYEVFAIVYLDNRHRVLGFEELFRGTIDGASVHPREVVKHALARNAAAVI